MQINQKFKELIPKLQEEEKQLLEFSILREGIREPLIVWNDVLIDGHNRYEIAQRHNLKYETKEMHFDNENEAMLWMLRNQLGRRNLTNYDRSLIALKMKPLIEEKAKENQRIGAEITNTGCQISDKAFQKVDTKKELAQIAKVSHDTINKVERIEAKAPEIVKQQIRNSTISINEAVKRTDAIDKASEVVKEKIITAITKEPEKNIDKIIKEIRNEEIIEKRKEVAESKHEARELNRKYDVIYCDPPWRYNSCEPTRAIENKYPTMSDEELMELKIPANENSVMYMWATVGKLPFCVALLEHWGFEYKSSLCWDKETIGMGYWARGQHEMILIGTKGKFSPPSQETRESSVYREKKTEHSKKPNYYYDLIEKQFPYMSYIEMFARQKYNEKWDVWGNEDGV